MFKLSNKHLGAALILCTLLAAEMTALLKWERIMAQSAVSHDITALRNQYREIQP